MLKIDMVDFLAKRCFFDKKLENCFHEFHSNINLEKFYVFSKCLASDFVKSLTFLFFPFSGWAAPFRSFPTGLAGVY